MLSIRDDWWDPAVSNNTSRPKSRNEDCQYFAGKLSTAVALDRAYDYEWPKQYGRFIERDRRFYIASLAIHLHGNAKSGVAFAQLQPFHKQIASALFGINGDDETERKLVARLRKWAEREDKQGVFSLEWIDQKNVDCIFFTSKQMTRLLKVCPAPPPKPNQETFDSRYPGSERL
ncbi:hypothetical protein [Bradyrhizobium sp. 195]|uniref:hypothetical protein n=1 Tax=Bradyrhizobium sp. 195 TaxID=2782662 RepID=UPI0020009628|nr:hypothetical protein [Bradyrhizobium sp. 195]UPK26751.1 hypothetical protein IVB26_36915 [Bradyrhizobium sp. 195]